MSKRPLFCIGAVYVLLVFLLLQCREELFSSAALAAEDSFQDEEVVEFGGKVKSIQRKEDQTLLTLRNACLWKENQSYESKGLLVYVKGSLSCNLGETLYGRGSLKKISLPENPGQFNARTYYYGKKIDYRIFSARIMERDGKQDPYLSFLQFLKEKIKYGFYRVFQEKDAGILCSMILGDKEGMEEETYALYQLAGIAHVFAISGLHVGLVGRGLYQLLRKIGLKFGQAFLVSMGVIVSYAILSGGSPSAVRAVIMFGLSVFAQVCGRGYDLLTALMVALVCLVTENPFLLLQTGVWLSFGAVFAIGFIYPYLEEYFKPGNVLYQSFLISFSVHIFTLPILTCSYYQFSAYGIFLNIIVVPLMTFVFVSGAAAGIVGILFPEAGMFLGGMAHYILLLYEKLCQWYLKIPAAVCITGKPEKSQILFYYVVMLIGIWGLKKFTGSKRKLKKIGVLALLGLSAVILFPLPKFHLEITMVDVGQGDGIFIQSPWEMGNIFRNSLNLFVDGGSTDIKEVGTYRMLPFLKSKGVNHIDKWLITHGDRDHYSGFLEILEEVEKGIFSVDTLCLPWVKNPGEGYEEVQKAAMDAGISVEYIGQGITWKTGKLKVRFLHPAKNYHSESENAYSLVFLLDYGKFRGLFTGDVEGEGEEGLQKYFQNQQPITLLKVAHHGSANSTTESFCRLIAPQMAWISAGAENNYGHPSKEVLERLERESCGIFQTPKQGAIWLKTNGKTFKVSCQKSR